MALIVEDGTGKTNSESYCSVAEATAYHGSRNQGDDWDAIDDKDAALRLATDYMLQIYRGKWAGSRVTSTQSLDWPRYDVELFDAPSGYGAFPAVVPFNVVPAEVKKACAELALKTGNGTLLVDTGREVLSESVGSISVTYSQGSSQQTSYPVVSAFVRPYMKPAGSRVYRA